MLEVRFKSGQQLNKMGKGEYLKLGKSLHSLSKQS